MSAFFATDSWREDEPSDFDEEIDFGDEADLGAAENMPVGNDRQEQRQDAPPHDDRLEQLSCLIAYNLNEFALSQNPAHRAEAFTSIQNTFRREYQRGGQNAVHDLFHALQRYTENGGAGGLVTANALITDHERNRWTLSIQETGNGGRRHTVAMSYTPR